ncbi:lipase family protein [Dapis sp. BLCC M172]|uniref:DUF6200 domain-containing protein n=1 Tax=Dapis sp. BLCC M172 TaxID=2975281 RepID=UPI003CF4AC9B
MATKYRTLQTEPAAPKAPSTEYTWEQILHSHIWLIYCLSHPKTYVGPKEYLKQLATESIQETFANARVKRLIGTWELVWGVAIYQFPTSEVNDNTLYIAKYNDNNPEKDTYVLCIAGTNMKSLYSLMFQDCDLFSTKKWNNGKPWDSRANYEATTEPSLSSGFTRGLNVVLNKAKDSNGGLVMDALQNITSRSTKPIDLFVVGHSLAGALAPLTALSLFERPSEWDSKGIATIKVFSLAAPTPGNKAFQTYYASKLGGEKTQRLWSPIDIVPNFATKQGLDNTGTIYEPDIPSTPLVDVFCSVWNRTIEHHDFQYITTQPPYSGQINNDFRIKHINQYPEVKEFLVDQCSGMIMYVFLKSLEQLEEIPGIGNVMSLFDDTLENTIELGSSIISKSLTEIIDEGVTVDLIDEKIESVFEEVLDQIWPMPLPFSPVSLIMSALPSGLINGESIYNLMDWYMQFFYQHTDEYITHYGIQEFFELKGKITSQVDAKLGKEENKKQQANTILVNYGKAKNDDIKDLYRGEGKLLENISDVVAQLKQSGDVERNAQPLILIVEKKG